MPIELIKNYITPERLNKMSKYLDLLHFYNGNYEYIKKIITDFYLDKPFSREELNKMNITHVKYINSIIDRKAAGIYMKDAQRIGIKRNGEYDDTLNEVIVNLKYDDIIKDAVKFGLLFNTVLVGVLLDKNIYNELKLYLQLLTPANCIIKVDNTGELEFVIIRAINEDNEIIYECWTKYNVIYFDENLQLIEEKENIYRTIPFVKLQLNKSLTDEFGEPAWDLFVNNIILDMKLSDLDYTEFFQRNSLLIAKNIKMQENQKLEITPRKLIQIEETPGLESQLNYITANPNINQFHNLVDWRVKNLYLTNSIANTTANLEGISQSGLAKKIDELVLLEAREELKTKLYYFEKKLLAKITKIYNSVFDIISNSPKMPIEAVDFEIIFNETKAYETIDDKIKRYEFLKKYNLIDDIDIVMSEFELTENEAIEYIKKRKERTKNIQIDSEVDNIISILTNKSE